MSDERDAGGDASDEESRRDHADRGRDGSDRHAREDDSGVEGADDTTDRTVGGPDADGERDADDSDADANGERDADESNADADGDAEEPDEGAGSDAGDSDRDAGTDDDSAEETDAADDAASAVEIEEAETDDSPTAPDDEDVADDADSDAESGGGDESDPDDESADSDDEDLRPEDDTAADDDATDDFEDGNAEESGDDEETDDSGSDEDREDSGDDESTEDSEDEESAENPEDDESEGPGALEISDEKLASAGVTVGEYDWDEFKGEFFYEDGSPPTNWRGKARPFEPEEFLGHDPAETGERVEEGAETAAGLSAYFEEYLDPEQTPVALGEYLWEHFRYEYYYDGEGMALPRDEDGEVVPFDRSEWLGHDDFGASVFESGLAVTDLSSSFEEWLDPATTPVTKGEYYWEHFKYEYYYTDTDVTAPERPRDDEGDIDRFEKDEWLGFPEEDIEELLAEGAHDARKLLQIEDERTLDVPEELDEDAFFSTVEGHTTLVNRYDLEKEVALPKKQHFRERDRYWVNKPYSFVVIFHSAKENETKYYLVEPHCTPIEEDLKEFLTKKLRSSIKYSSDDVVVEAEEQERAEVIERETLQLLARYDLYAENDGERAEQLADLLDRYDETRDAVRAYVERLREETDEAIEPVREFVEERRERRAEAADRADDGDAELGDAADSDPEAVEGAEPGSEDSSADADAATDPDDAADGEEVAADGGAVGDDASAESEVGSAESEVESADEPDAPAPWQPDEPDPATEVSATADEGDLPATTDDEDRTEPRVRLDEYLDLDFEAEGTLREQLRAAVEAKIEELRPDDDGGLDGIMVRPEPVLIEEDSDDLSEYQAEKLLYYLRRDFVGYERIDGIKHDINVEDISCDGYNAPVFVYHTDYEQVITNVYHGKGELDDFVVKMAQRSGKGISKRQPQVDATLPDGSRAQLTLGREVSDHGTNYTIRQFKDVPFTPVDLVNWNTFSLEEMAFMWLAIENHKSLIFAGGTASGKTTSLNAVSLFIPSNTKIVSIEDTREVELPQRNWIASVTRPSFSDDDKGDVDEFDLLEAALRQRPDYIVMGEIRGEEGRTLFQVMSTGHTTYTTFHADTVGEVLKRFTTEPINVSKTLFTALDLVSIQTQTRVQGSKVRRNKSLTEINEYSAENDEINVQDIFQWRAEDDEYMRLSGSNTMDEIMFDRGWDRDRLEKEILKRRVILAYLIKNGLNEYTQVAATVQAFINDPDTILTLVANEKLEESLQDLREMESVQIDVDPKKEEMVPRPDPSEDIYELAKGILAEAEDRLLDDYRGADADVEGLAVALAESAEPTDAPAEIRPDSDEGGPPRDAPRSGDSTGEPDTPFGGDLLDSEPRDESPVEDTESVGPEDSVRNVNDAGELGNFPDVYDETEDGSGDDFGEGSDLGDGSDPGDEFGSGDGFGSGEGLDPEEFADEIVGGGDPDGDDAGDDTDSFGDFEAAFDADSDRDDATEEDPT
ncbi:ATPase, T2SS/T4P/T4SS family [Halorussus salinus]|uniref:ATPase, T2SS/T4P/T4SS family n=1 Tax=Halorussus salinus TaxID=1364935 RepID=UPI0034A27F55